MDKVRWRAQMPWCEISEGERSHRDCPMLRKRCTWPAACPFMACHLSDCLFFLKLTIIDPSCRRPVWQAWVQQVTQCHHGTMCLMEFKTPVAPSQDKEVLKGRSWKEERLLLLLVCKIPAGLRNGHSFFCRKLTTRKDACVEACALSEA